MKGKLFYSDLSNNFPKAKPFLCYFHVHVISSSRIELTERWIEDIYIFMGQEYLTLMLKT